MTFMEGGFRGEVMNLDENVKDFSHVANTMGPTYGSSINQ